MHGQGACISGGIHGRGDMCGRGACMAGGVHGRGHAWQGGMHGRYYEIRSMSGQYASSWNAFLYLKIRKIHTQISVTSV